MHNIGWYKRILHVVTIDWRLNIKIAQFVSTCILSFERHKHSMFTYHLGTLADQTADILLQYRPEAVAACTLHMRTPLHYAGTSQSPTNSMESALVYMMHTPLVCTRCTNVWPPCDENFSVFFISQILREILLIRLWFPLSMLDAGKAHMLWVCGALWWRLMKVSMNVIRDASASSCSLRHHHMYRNWWASELDIVHVIKCDVTYTWYSLRFVLHSPILSFRWPYAYALLCVHHALGYANASTRLRRVRTSAACRGHLTMVKLLLKHGARVDARDNSGSTAMDCASVNGYPKVQDNSDSFFPW